MLTVQLLQLVSNSIENHMLHLIVIISHFSFSWSCGGHCSNDSSIGYHCSCVFGGGDCIVLLLERKKSTPKRVKDINLDSKVQFMRRNYK